ncbi:MAG: PEP-CTERM sorting domain-containing protein [Planctomycetaceae bacterium]
MKVVGRASSPIDISILPGGRVFNLEDDSTIDFSVESVSVVDAAVSVPEPSSMGIWALGFIGLARMARRGKAAA